MIAFPNGLPGVSLASFSAADNSRVRSNDVSSGPPLFELMTADAPMIASVSWSMSRIQFQIFDAWFKFNCRYGAESFGLKLPVGAGTVEHECWFANGNYTHTFNGRRVGVSAELVAARRIYETDAEVAIVLVGLGSNDLFDVIDGLNEFAEIYLPPLWVQSSQMVALMYSEMIPLQSDVNGFSEEYLPDTWGGL